MNTLPDLSSLQNLEAYFVLYRQQNDYLRALADLTRAGAPEAHASLERTLALAEKYERRLDQAAGLIDGERFEEADAMIREIIAEYGDGPETVRLATTLFFLKPADIQVDECLFEGGAGI